MRGRGKQKGQGRTKWGAVVNRSGESSGCGGDGRTGEETEGRGRGEGRRPGARRAGGWGGEPGQQGPVQTRESGR